MPHDGYPLPNRMVVVVRNRLSWHNILQVHLKVLSISVSRWSSDQTQVLSVARFTVWMYIERLRYYMPYHDVANLVTVTNTNMIDKMPSGYWTGWLSAAWIQHQVSWSVALRSQLLSKSPADQHRGLSCFKIWLSFKSNIGASWIRVQNCRCFQKHLIMLLQSLRALCLAPAGPGSIWKCLGVLERSTRVSERFVCIFLTDLPFADIHCPEN